MKGTNLLIYSQNPRSQGAKRLAQSLGIRRIRHNNSRFRGLLSPWVINWGAAAIPLPWKERVRLLNAPEAVERVSNKLSFFELIEENDEAGIIPPWTNLRDVAEGDIDDGYKVVCRTILNGHGGIGIHIASTVDELVDAPLYVQYIPKKAEYRFHLFNDKCIDIQRKVRDKGTPCLDWRIRSHLNGFFYVRNGDRPGVLKAAKVAGEAFRLTDLLFGAVDVIYNEKQDRAYVLEINTAPGLEGQTVRSYANAIREYTGE